MRNAVAREMIIPRWKENRRKLHRGVHKKKTTKRECLRCDQSFESYSIGNRICNQCKTHEDMKRDIVFH